MYSGIDVCQLLSIQTNVDPLVVENAYNTLTKRFPHNEKVTNLAY